jgi:predicted membrane protein
MNWGLLAWIRARAHTGRWYTGARVLRARLRRNASLRVYSQLLGLKVTCVLLWCVSGLRRANVTVTDKLSNTLALLFGYMQKTIFIISMPRRNCLPELTYSSYLYQLQNLSFNLAVLFFYSPKDYADITKTNGSRTVCSLGVDSTKE